jgi:arabinan endo-1,5-alpha-L-arabinosidase
MDRRTFLGGVGSALGAFAAGCTAISGQSGESNGSSADCGDREDRGTYHNPVFEPVFADPTVTRADDGFFYTYATANDWGDGEGLRVVPICRSSDLVNWEYVGEAFDRVPQWLARTGPADRIWAPDIARYRDRYYLYYSLVDRGPEYALEEQGIGVATADDPAGPFTDHGKVFQGFEVGVLNSIDPQFYLNDGVPYLLWGSLNGLYLTELSADGRRPVGEKTRIGGNRFEAAYVTRREGYYYLFVSSGVCCVPPDVTYQVEVGRATSLSGPYETRYGRDLRDSYGTLVMTESDRFLGPGHNAIATDDCGTDWLLYHAYDRSDPYLANGPGDPRRSLMLDRLVWEDGWPRVENRAPSLAAERPAIDPS